MPAIKVEYKRKESGTPLEAVDELVASGFVDHVVADHRATPDQFAGQGRHNSTPFHDSGELIAGFEFKKASRTGRSMGLLGTVRAPASRFNDPRVRDKFMVYLESLWAVRGVGWSKGGL